MFRLKKKSPKDIRIADSSDQIFNESIDYAKYLLEIHYDKSKAADSLGIQDISPTLQTVPKQVINLDDLRAGK